uniref:Uncharacterized protein n=1 Tax=Malurus cyaneus samueli TaxID=2593467 RepID=A0A8C5U6V9_9PASS
MHTCSRAPCSITGCSLLCHTATASARGGFLLTREGMGAEPHVHRWGWLHGEVSKNEIFCKAATIVQEGHSCHKYLEGIYRNLLGLARETRAGHKVSTTSLKNFLEELHRVLQEEYKSQK